MREDDDRVQSPHDRHRPPEVHLLDPQMTLEHTAMRDRNAAPHPIENEPQVNYPQIDADEHELSHVAFLDGSAMIHAAFAAQAMELAAKEREEAGQHDSYPGNGRAGEGREQALHDYPYSSEDHTRSEVDIHEIPPLEDSQRSSKRRKTAFITKRLKGKGKMTSEDAFDGVAPDQGPSATHNDIWPAEHANNMALGFRRNESASKRQTTTNSASRKQSHIEAEQKRRAAIKSGYEALYRVIPALRDADLKEGKDRGGSGPGGGGARAVRTAKLDDEALDRPSEPTKDAGTSPAEWSREHSAGELRDDVNLAESTQTASTKSYSRRQQPNQHGKPLRPGVRSILPLVRQPGSEVIDGRQGPRSESVVLQQTVLYLRQEQAQRLGLTRRLRALRRLAQRKIPQAEHGRLGLGPRTVESGIPVSGISIESNDMSACGTWPLKRQSPHPTTSDLNPLSTGFDLKIDRETGEALQRFSGVQADGMYFAPDGLSSNPRVDARELTDDQVVYPREPDYSESAARSMEDVRGDHYPATLEAALDDDYQASQRTRPTASALPVHDPYLTQERVDRESYRSMSEANEEGHDPPNREASSGKRVVTDWEGEWSGGGFDEGEDIEA